MNRRRTILMTLIALLEATYARAGPHSHTRDGVVYGIDFGWGWTQAQITENGTTLNSGWVDDLTGGLRVGFAPADNLVYGLEIGGWAEHTGLLDESIYWIQAAARYYPAGQGFWVKGGAGLGTLQIDYVTPAAFISKSSSGLAWNAGLGYEMRIKPTLALGLIYDYHHVSVGEIVTLDDVKTAVQSIALAVTWYTD